VIKARGVGVERSGRLVLSGVDFSARHGEVTVILGSNGAGKSTLLRTLTGDLKCSSGSVVFAGRRLEAWSVAELARIRAVVPQSSALNFPFQVLEVVLQGRAPHLEGGERMLDEAEAMQALRIVGMEDYAGRDYTTLSGGERQRVHVARAFAQIGADPVGRCLLLDEPTANLDLKYQHEILRLVAMFARAGGCAVVVLHDLNLAVRYADRVVILKCGHLLAAGDAGAAMIPEMLSAAYGIPVFESTLPTTGGRFFVVRE